MNDALFKIDPITAALTLVGYLGVDINYAQDCAIDENTGLLYLAGHLNWGLGGGVWNGHTYYGASHLYLIDTYTGGAYNIGATHSVLDNEYYNEIDGFAIANGPMCPEVPSLHISNPGQLTWLPVQDATSYKVYGSDTPDGNYTLLANVTTCNWLDSVQSSQRFYKVIAVNEAERQRGENIMRRMHLPPKAQKSGTSSSTSVAPRVIHKKVYHPNKP